MHAAPFRMSPQSSAPAAVGACLLAAAAADVCAAGPTNASPVETLLETGAIACKPHVTHYCRNIHIGCSGRSRIHAFTFTLMVEGDRARISFHDKRNATAPPGRTGRLDRSDDLDYVVVWLDPPPEHVKVNASGTFSAKILSDGVSYMAYGRCR